MKIPFVDLKRIHHPRRAAYQAVFDRVMEDTDFIRGAAVQHFEEQFAARVGVDHAIAVSSGTDALLLALMAHEIGPGDEVIVPDFTFFAPAGCVARLGATPVFVDIEPEHFMLDVTLLEEALSPKTKAIIVVHLFGQCAQMGPITEFAAKHDLVLIEDCAQAAGAHQNGVQAGGLGKVGCFSFFPTKNLGGFGDGGMITTADAELAERLRILTQHGSGTKYTHTHLGGNFRLDTLQAGLLSVALGHLDAENEARRRHAGQYEELLGATLKLPKQMATNHHTYHQFVIRLKNRDQVRAMLMERGIDAMVYYPNSMASQPVWKGRDIRRVGHETAEKTCSEVLALPIYSGLRDDELERVANTLMEVVGLA